MSKRDAIDQVGLDPTNDEDCKVTIEEIADFINSERVAAGKPRCKTIIVIGSDLPYDQLGDMENVEFNS